MHISALDHLVLTVKDIPITVDFYVTVLGMKKIMFAEGRTALLFGEQKINLHEVGNEFEPKAGQVQNGSADLCFITGISLADVVKKFQEHNIYIIDGPVKRTGALGSITSVYCRDPDGNLIEISTYE